MNEPSRLRTDPLTDSSRAECQVVLQSPYTRAQPRQLSQRSDVATVAAVRQSLR